MIADITPIARRLRLGERTVTVRLEPILWRMVDETADRRGESLEQVVTRLAETMDVADRTGPSLSTLLRLYALDHVERVAVHAA